MKMLCIYVSPNMYINDKFKLEHRLWYKYYRLSVGLKDGLFICHEKDYVIVTFYVRNNDFNKIDEILEATSKIKQDIKPNYISTIAESDIVLKGGPHEQRNNPASIIAKNVADIARRQRFYPQNKAWGNKNPGYIQW